MKSRPIAAAFFVIFCLLLCGLILRRQIAAHPLPPASAERFTDNTHGFSPDIQGWHPASPSIVGQAHKTVEGQLTALRNGDGVRASSYQSRAMRQKFGGPAQFEQMMVAQYPEFGRYRQIAYGPVWTDPSGQWVRARVTVVGQNGRRARGIYQLIQEDGQWKINEVDAWPMWD